MAKFYKIVFGFGPDDYISITQDELHKAFVLAIEGGSAVFEGGFFQNRGKDIMRIVPDWHRVRGWNKGHKMDTLDYEDIAPLEKSFLNTLSNGKQLAEYIIREKRSDLLAIPASEAFRAVPQLSPSQEAKQLADKFSKL